MMWQIEIVYVVDRQSIYTKDLLQPSSLLNELQLSIAYFAFLEYESISFEGQHAGKHPARRRPEHRGNQPWRETTWSVAKFEDHAPSSAHLPRNPRHEREVLAGCAARRVRLTNLGLGASASFLHTFA